MEVLPERRTESPLTPPSSDLGTSTAEVSAGPPKDGGAIAESLMSSVELAQQVARNAGVTEKLVYPPQIARHLGPAAPVSDSSRAISSQMRVPSTTQSEEASDQALTAVAPATGATANQMPHSTDPSPETTDAPAQGNVGPTPSTNQLQAKSSLSHPSLAEAKSRTVQKAAPALASTQMNASDTPNSSLGPSPTDSARNDGGATPTSPASSDTDGMFAKREISQIAQTHQPMSALSSFSSRASLCRHSRHATEPPPAAPHTHHHSRPNTHSSSSVLDASVLGTSCNNCTCPSPPSSPPLQPSDRARIRTPASAVSSRRNSVIIGERIPFESMAATAAPTRTSPADSVLPRVTHQRVGLNYAPARIQLPHELEQHSAPPTAQNSPPHTPRSRCGSTTSLHLARDDHPRRTHLPAIDDLSIAAPDRRGSAPLKQLRGRKAPLYIPAVLRPTEASSYTAANPAGMARRAGQSMQPPPHDHWVSDSARTSCAACLAPFTLLGRRHHCRKCGEIFCARDSRFVVALNQSLQFNLFGYPSRACANCSAAFTKHVLESSRLSSEPSQPALPQGGPQAIAVRQGQESSELLAGSLANMPVDWNWSTF